MPAQNTGAIFCKLPGLFSGASPRHRFSWRIAFHLQSRLLLGFMLCLAFFTAFGIFSETGRAQTAQPPRPAHSALSDPLAPPRPDPLRVAHDEGLWPFSFKDKAQYAGFELELWAKVAEGMGVEYELIPMEFAEILPALQKGEIDVAIAAIPVTAARQERVQFSIPYFRTGLVGLCRNGDDGAVKPADDPGSAQKSAKSTTDTKNAKNKNAKSKSPFEGKLVAVQRNSAAAEYAARNMPEATLKICAYQEEMFFELLAKNVDAVFAEQNLIDAYLNVSESDSLSKCSELYSVHNMAIAVPKGSVHLKELNRSLQSFRSTEEFKELSRKWFGMVPNFGK